MKKVKCYGRRKSAYTKPESSFVRNFFDGDIHKSNLWDISSTREILKGRNIYYDADSKENNLSCEPSPNLSDPPPELFDSLSNKYPLNVPVKEITNFEESVVSSRHVTAKMDKKVRLKKKNLRGVDRKKSKNTVNTVEVSNRERKKSKHVVNSGEVSWSNFLNHNLVIENLNTQKKKKLSFSNVPEIEDSYHSASIERHSSFINYTNVFPACSVSNSFAQGEKKNKWSLRSKRFQKSKECSSMKTKNNIPENISQKPSISQINSSDKFHQSLLESFSVEKQNLNFSLKNIHIFTSTPVVRKDLVTDHISTSLISFCQSKSEKMCRKLTDIFTITPTEKSCDILHNVSSFQDQDQIVNNFNMNAIFSISTNASKFNFSEHNKPSRFHSTSQQKGRSLTDSRTRFDSDSQCKKSHSCLNSKSLVHSLSHDKSGETFQDQLAKLLFMCNQKSVKAFSELYDWSIIKVVKIGEGTYGEVFLVTKKRVSSVLKVIPISYQSKADCFQELQNIISEVKISKCLSRLKKDERNCSKNFIEVKSVHVVNGLYPSTLIDAWDNFSEDKSTYNARPDEYSEDQVYVILELEYGGKDLSCFVFKDASEGESVLKQVAVSLAIAEEEYLFEHRDLHLGNILVRRNHSKSITYKLRGQSICIQSKGLHVTLIDFTLSRLYENGFIYYYNLAEDTSLFNQTGDCQFDVYRSMKFHLGNQWHEGLLYSNVLWLNFLSVKLTEFVYSRPTSVKHTRGLRSIQQFQKNLHSCKCAVDCLVKCEIVAALPTRNPPDSRLLEKSHFVTRNSGLKSKSMQNE